MAVIPGAKRVPGAASSLLYTADLAIDLAVNSFCLFLKREIAIRVASPSRKIIQVSYGPKEQSLLLDVGHSSSVAPSQTPRGINVQMPHSSH